MNKPNVRPAISKSFWIKLGLVPFVMFAFAFALVPLYNTFCDITGINGRSSNEVKLYEGKIGEVDDSRKIDITFVSATTPGFPVTFYPLTKNMEIVPGKINIVNFYARNRSDEEIIGQAIPSIAPGEAASHLHKLQCFCFTQQTFKPKTPVIMPVRFFVDSKLNKDIVDMTLSYNFIRIKKTDQAKQLAALNKRSKL